jgi:hypothetical protein
MMWLITLGALLVGAGWSVALAILFWLVGYAASCWIYPRVDCTCCHGGGKHRSKKDSRRWRRCWWCGGQGSFYRLGRRMWNATAGARRLDDRV